ncbi:hypothetical protein BpHYR1_041522 [Brachionus plicatilis]|uniref:Uncharacterized protein n=1 Tax=Brachionus plicatilis TaxID=10195 RepID=A0A3M7S3Q7_BRAPC|nr:hypothetical protein BpHYR1_041522 [Brachionus plicatilis]
MFVPNVLCFCCKFPVIKIFMVKNCFILEKLTFVVLLVIIDLENHQIQLFASRYKKKDIILFIRQGKIGSDFCALKIVL